MSARWLNPWGSPGRQIPKQITFQRDGNPEFVGP